MAELNLKNFPDDLHKRLKMQAAKEGKKLRELVIEILEQRRPIPFISERKSAK